MADLRRLWTRLGEREVALMRPEECVRQSKLDEARLSFVRALDGFLQDLKKAHQFAVARQEKAARQAALQAARARLEEEEEDEEDETATLMTITPRSSPPHSARSDVSEL